MKIGGTSAACPGDALRGSGGYTYGDFGDLVEPHAAGEVWGQTLWDLREALGVTLTRSLVTRALELSAASPSFLDMRDAILQADQVVDAGKATNTIWKVFAHRGMGWFATPSLDGAVTQPPIEDFSLPPAPGTPKGTITGLIRDRDTRSPAPGVTVAVLGHSGLLGGRYVGTTGRDGRFSIPGVLPGTYPLVTISGGGYLGTSRPLTVSAEGATVNVALRRNWGSPDGGASVVDDNAETDLGGCYPADALDGSQSTGWSVFRYSQWVEGTARPRYFTVRLPRAVDLNQVRIDPADLCGEPDVSVRRYRVETSTDGVAFTVAAEGTFSTGQAGRLNDVILRPGSGRRVTHVRYTVIDTNASSCPAFLGPLDGVNPACLSLGTAELQLLGIPAG